MAKKGKSSTIKVNEDDESLKDVNEKNEFAQEIEEESSGAEAYVEQAEEEVEAQDENIDYEKIKQDLLKEYAENKEEETTEEIEEIEEDPIEEVEDENVDYEKIKQDLLKEYSENKEEESTEELEEIEEDISETIESNDKSLEENNSYKVNLDDNLEIEDIQENLDGNVINKPKSMIPEQQAVAPDVDQGISKVAISKGSSLAILVGLVLLLIYVIYKILQPSEEELAAKKSTINQDLPIVTPVEDVGQTIVVPEIPAFPDMPKELTPPAPKALPTPPMPSTLDIAVSSPVLPSSPAGIPVPAAPPVGGAKPLEAKMNIAAIDKAAAAKADADAARKKARMKSSMMAGGSGGGSKKGKNAAGQSLTILERNSSQTVATHIGELQRVIAQGKIVDAVLETAINTDLPGLIRAVVTRDVYSEAGTNILINKGSRLIGSYSSEIKFGQARVQIAWTRVIRPDGVDIQIDSPGIDDIGRSGSAGEVDNHILRNFTTAMMVSLINIGVAEYADSNGSSSSTSTTTTNTDGSTTNTDDSSTVDQAYDDAIDNISSIGTDVIDKTKDMPPTITINQGTSLKVFVKQDLVFPGKSANLTRLME